MPAHRRGHHEAEEAPSPQLVLLHSDSKERWGPGPFPTTRAFPKQTQVRDWEAQEGRTQLAAMALPLPARVDSFAAAFIYHSPSACSKPHSDNVSSSAR